MSITREMIIKRELHTDIVVVGGGVAGCAAAIAAARTGAKTLLVEQWGSLGGAATLCLVSPVGAERTISGKRYGGILEEVFDEVRKMTVEYCAGNAELSISPHILKYVLLNKAVSSGVELALHSRLVDAVIEGSRIKGIVIHDKSGFKAIFAKNFIDTTGDGDLMALAGDDWVIGSEPGVMDSLVRTGMDTVHEEKGENKIYKPYEESGALQPVSSMFFMAGVDIETAAPLINKSLTFDDLNINKAEFKKEFYYGTNGFEENGDLIPLPQGRILFFTSSRKNEVIVNMSRVTGIDASCADELTKAEIIVQHQTIAIAAFLKKYVKGFENSYITDSSFMLGIRETRRLKGRYVLTGTDVINCVIPDDSVAFGSYIIDIHDPKGKRKAIGGAVKGDYYGIPYNSLISAKLDNLAVAGRCISADHVAHSSTRVQGTCMLTGQAAGVAAALSVIKNKTYSELTPAEIRCKLKEDGLLLL